MTNKATARVLYADTSQRGLTATESAKALKDIADTLGVSLPVRKMPRARLISQRQADRVKAAQMLAAEILAAVERCEALEREA